MQDALVLQGKRLRLEVDAQKGVLKSIRIKNDPLSTEFCANETNLLYPEMKDNDQWLGDWLLRVWDGASWRVERTASSCDTRTVQMDRDGVTVRYDGQSKAADGIQSVSLNQRFSFDGDDLLMNLTLENKGDALIELGEVSLALMTNTDFNSVFEQLHKDTPYHWYGPKQRDWHEQRLFQHLHLAGHNSYVFLQRPKGDFPALMMLPEGDTSVETAYQMVPDLGSQWSLNFEGPYYLALHSKAPREVHKWLHCNEGQRYWFNGNSSLLLKPGDARSFAFRFAVVNSYQQAPEKMVEHGMMAVHAVPGMVAPLDQSIYFALTTKGGKPSIRLECNNARVEYLGVSGETYRYALHATAPGQKKLAVTFGERQTNLLFFVLDDVRETLHNHAAFVAHRQFYDNPDDAFNRHGLFMPYDDTYDALFLRSEEGWQVGGADEYCFTVAMFLAEKNALFPEQSQIDKLERFVEEGLWRSGLLDEQSFQVIRGLYWEDKTPSDCAQDIKWDYERSRSTLRTFNYPLLMDIFFSMYQIGKRFDMTRKHSADDYLDFAFRCAMHWFDLGRNKNNGAPAGATIIEVLEALKADHPDQYQALYPLVERCAKMNSEVEYPYGSELYVDQTPHNQVHALLSYFGHDQKKQEAYRITKALRAGMQPTWYKYGNEKRGNVCVWYATPLNTRVLFQGFEETGDREMLRWGSAGLLSFLTTQRLSGVGHGWYTWWPDRSMFDTRSLDTDMGMYGYFKSAKAYVIKDEVFGYVGYGCDVHDADGMLRVRVNDGVGRRLQLHEQGVDIETLNLEIKQLTLKDGVLDIEAAPVSFQASEQSVTIKAGGLRVKLNGQDLVEGKNMVAQ